MMMWQVRVVRSVLRKSGKIFSGSSGSRFSSQVVQVNSLKLRERERERAGKGASVRRVDIRLRRFPHSTSP